MATTSVSARFQELFPETNLISLLTKYGGDADDMESSNLSNHLPHGSPKSVRLILHRGCPSFQKTIPSITWVFR